MAASRKEPHSKSAHSSLDEDTPEFVNLEARYRCAKCGKPMKEPLQLKCGHRICRICFDELKASYKKGQNVIIKCPVEEDDVCTSGTSENEFPTSKRRDQRRGRIRMRPSFSYPVSYIATKHLHALSDYIGKIISTHSIYLDKSAMKEMKQLIVYCSYRRFGCPAKIKWVELNDHCNNCSYQPLICKYCGLQISTSEAELQAHLRTCTSLQPCIYHLMGCDYKGTAEDLEHHLLDYQSHLKVVLNYNMRLSKEKAALEEQLQRVNNEVRSLNSQLSQQTQEKRTLETDFDQFKLELEQFREAQKQEFGQLVQRLRRLELRVVGEGGGKSSSQIEEEMRLVGVRQKQQLTVIEDLKKDLQQLSIRINAPMDMLEAHSVLLEQLQKKLHQLTLRTSCLEAMSHEGILIWKIPKFSERRKDALEGRILSVYSEPFYSQRYGYKMCCRLYPNGDGLGAGTHLSLFFVVMQGEYDAILDWPFKQKVTLMLMNQLDNRKFRYDSFRPDPSSSSYKKPVQFMNTASGCPKFISLKELLDESNGFLKDDCIYLKAQVELSTASA